MGDKRLWLPVAAVAGAGLVLRNSVILLMAAVASGLLLYSQSQESKGMNVRKIKYNKDTGKFEVFIENKGEKPIWLNYVIRSIEAKPTAEA